MTPLNSLDTHHCPLVLIGGTLCNERLWQPMLDSLKVSDVICLTPEGAESAHALSRQWLASLPPRFCLVGFSLGAIVALQMLADAPERIAGLALISVNPLADAAENATARRQAPVTARKEGLNGWLTNTLWPRYVAPHRLDDEQLHHTILRMAEESGFTTFAQQAEVAISRSDNRTALAAFTAPTLIINGAHDPICTPQHHHLAFSAAANARQETFAACGHFLPLEDPQHLATLLYGWLKESLS